MSRALILYDDVFRLHKDPFGDHMESPERITRVFNALREAGIWPYFVFENPRRIGIKEKRLCEVHSCDYVEKIRKISEEGGGIVDPDTYANEYTFQAGLRYAEAVIDASNRILSNEYDIVFVPGRPPGHHAGIFGSAMGAPTLGFCIFNVSALAALHLASFSRSRVLVVDFDLHHGNGTQEILYDKPDIIHLDLHQDPSTIYPGTGWPWQIGEGEAKGTKINVLVPPDTGDDVYISLFDKAIDMILDYFGKPDYIVVDAGFDGYIDDGLGLLRLTTNTYYHIGRRLRELGNKVLIVFEGGYLAGLRHALPAFLAGILGMYNPSPEEMTQSDKKTWEQALKDLDETMKNIKEALMKH